MYHYSILQPFNLNWKFTAPKSFTELEYFLTPSLSIGIDRMSNGKNDFAVGAYLTGGMNRTLFTNEHLVKRSDERTKNAFDKEDVSVYFTPAEAKDIEALFTEERFIARQIKIYKNGNPRDLFALDEDDFSKVMEAFVELGIQQSIDFKTEKESFEDLRGDMYQEAYKKARESFSNQMKKRERVTKKELYKQVGIGSGCVIVGGLLKNANRVLRTKGFFGFVAGAVCNLASVVVGMIGMRHVDGAVSYYTDGVVFE